MIPRIEHDWLSIEKKVAAAAALEKRARRRWLIKIWLVCAMLFCTGKLYAYANFRSTKGEMFLNAINSTPAILYLKTANTWAIETGEDIFRDKDFYTPYHVSSRYVYCWGSNINAAMAYYRTIYPEIPATTVVHEKTMLSIYVTKFNSPRTEEDATKSADLLTAAIKRMVNQNDMTWVSSLVAQLRHLRSLATYMVGFYAPEFVTQVIPILFHSMTSLPIIVPLLLLVLSPSWLAIPVFWLWVVLSALYVVLPPRAWKWMKNGAKLLWRRVRDRATAGGPRDE
ncbi:MAG: hypothetical protein ACYDHF_00520 [Candidatus Cryosericum sp.]